MWGPESIWGIAIAGLGVFVSAVMYAMGGTTGFGKYWRRFIASGVLTLDALFVSYMAGAFDLRYLLMYPCLAVGFSLGYSGSSRWIMALRRLLCALGVVSACLVGLWITGFTPMGYLVLVLAILTGISTVALGIFNPWSNAPLEQFLISILLTMYIPWWGFIR